jgi:HPt (histidine-containing phosphotransfer) domain-containing protein
MFLENGFNDFISKPINADELQDIIQKYLPEDKVKVGTGGGDNQAQLDKEEQLRRKTIVAFVKENHDAHEKITNLLSQGDIKTAHRIAHTLKSLAGYLGQTKLQEAAFALEHSLKGETDEHTPEQFSAFEKELLAALAEFEPIVKEAESEKHEVVEVAAEELLVLLTELETLLVKGDFGASEYAEKLHKIAGMEDLAEKIDDYDFEGALQLLNKIKQE